MTLKKTHEVWKVRRLTSPAYFPTGGIYGEMCFPPFLKIGVSFTKSIHIQKLPRFEQPEPVVERKRKRTRSLFWWLHHGQRDISSL